MESKTQPAWYENVAGKKHRKKISSAKKCGQSPKDTADSFSSPVNKTSISTSDTRGAYSQRGAVAKNSEKTQNFTSQKNLSAKKATFAKNKSAKTKIISSMFIKDKIPSDSKIIIENFDEVAFSALNLSSKQKIQLSSNIKKLSHQLTDERSNRRIGYMNDASSVAAYVTYFMWWNIVRLTRLFANIPTESLGITENSVCLDVGSGPLTVPISLWLSKSELRSKKLTFYCMDLSQSALSIGEELYLSIVARTLKQNEVPWKIVRVKGALGTQLKESADFICCANLFNELAQTNEMPTDYLAKKYTNDILQYAQKNSSTKQTVLIIEPGDPHSARLVSLMRDSLMRKNFYPVSPCPHFHACPMEGRTSSNPHGKWCNFAFATEDAPTKLLSLSEKSFLSKDRAGLSYVLASNKEEAKENLNKIKNEDSKNNSMELRIASDFIRLPELKKSGWYACSPLGLVLAVDMTNVRPKNGDLLKTKITELDKKLGEDKKSGAKIIYI